MKNIKLSLWAKILAVAVLLIVVYSVASSIAVKPTVTEGEFPFTITYELNGETVTIKDVYKAYYEGNDGYADTKGRIYEGEIGDLGEGNTVYTIKKDESGRVELWTHFYPDYLMGDTEYDYFDGEPFQPKIYYYDSQENEYHDEQTLLAQGVKLISYEYPEPLENSFVFSHISYFSCAVVLPTMLIALLAIVAVMIVVKKEKELKYKAIDIVSIVLGFVVCLPFLLFVSIIALLIDIEGGGPEFYYQVLYFIPSVTMLSMAASIALRRKGHGVQSLIVKFVGPAVFGLYLIACKLFDLL